MAVKVKARVTKGMTFRSVYADSNALWKVNRSRGKGVWECEIVNEPVIFEGKTYNGDYAGATRLFSTEEIFRIVGLSQLFGSLADQSDAWFDGLTLGQIVHYDNGFGAFVRCKVVEAEGEKQLAPFALVGKWRSFDLPQRTRTGDVHYPYYPKMILEEPETFRPHASNIYEFHALQPPAQPDPATLEPIDLTLPEMTREQKGLAAMWTAIENIRTLTGYTEGNPATLLRDIREIVDIALGDP